MRNKKNKSLNKKIVIVNKNPFANPIRLPSILSIALFCIELISLIVQLNGSIFFYDVADLISISVILGMWRKVIRLNFH